MYSRKTCFRRRFGLDDLQSSFLTPTILWTVKQKWKSLYLCYTRWSVFFLKNMWDCLGTWNAIGECDISVDDSSLPSSGWFFFLFLGSVIWKILEQFKSTMNSIKKWYIEIGVFYIKNLDIPVVCEHLSNLDMQKSPLLGENSVTVFLMFHW